ncbi:MAG: hypothetical protein IPN57_09110 [Ignavibacteria bacterium]|nr:hypothetical protein [Ignavibacteria bacterium]
MDKIGFSFEVIFVTDINKDNTVGALRDLNEKDVRIKFIKLSNGLDNT